jgi:hypothetical protein
MSQSTQLTACSVPSPKLTTRRWLEVASLRTVLNRR